MDPGADETTSDLFISGWETPHRPESVSWLKLLPVKPLHSSAGTLHGVTGFVQPAQRQLCPGQGGHHPDSHRDTAWGRGNAGAVGLS